MIKNPLREIFSSNVIERWRRYKNPSEHLKFRIEVITACGPEPDNLISSEHLRFFRAYKAAWETYILAGLVCGLFKGNDGKELRARITDIKDDNFRSAMAECMACWFFAGPLKFEVSPKPPGKKTGKKEKKLDLLLKHSEGDINIEVKAPFREITEKCFHLNDSNLLVQCIEDANKQFPSNSRNILFIAPKLRISVFQERFQLLSAFYGEDKITVPINMKTGGPAGPTTVKFFPEGKFLNRKRPNGKNLKPDGMPGYTRVSAVICVEEKIREKYPWPNPFVLLDKDNRYGISQIYREMRSLHYSNENRKWIDHDVLILHNPYSKYPIPEHIFKQFVQFVKKNNHMEWTDNYNIEE